MIVLIDLWRNLSMRYLSCVTLTSIVTQCQHVRNVPFSRMLTLQQSVSYSFVWKPQTFHKVFFLGRPNFFWHSQFFYIFLKFKKKIFTIVLSINLKGLFFYTKDSPTRFSHKSQSRKFCDLRFLIAKSQIGFAIPPMQVKSGETSMYPLHYS